MSNVMNEPKWWHGESDEAEQWFGPHDTREQCISKGVSYHEGEPFVITQAKTALLSFEFDEQDVEQFLENWLYISSLLIAFDRGSLKAQRTLVVQRPGLEPLRSQGYSGSAKVH